MTTGQDERYQLAGRAVARVGYGAMQLEANSGEDRAAALALLRDAVELGVDHVDTAQFYGEGTVNGLIAEALAPYPEQLVIATKVGADRRDGTLVPAQRPEELRASVESNLRALGTDRLDVVNLRRVDAPPGIVAEGDQRVDLDAQLETLVALRDAGTIGAIGLSNVSAEQLRAALPVGIACVQNAYSLVDRAAEPVLALCRSEAVAFVPFFPLGSAFPGRSKVTDQPAVIAAAEAAGATPAQVGLAWLLGHAPNILLIPGTRSERHLTENVAAAEVRLGAEAVAALDEMARAPAGAE